MTVETALYPNQLNASWPAQSDIVREGAGHIRTVKTVFRTTFPNVTGAVSPTHVELNYMVGVTSSVQAQINTKGDIAGQTWTGTHTFGGAITVPAKPQATNTSDAASTAFVQAEFSTRLPNYTAPITASTTELNRLVGVTGDVQAQIDAKGNVAGQAWTGTHNFAGASAMTLPSNTSIGSVSDVEIGYLDGVTAPIQSQFAGKADINGESYTGTHDFTSANLTAQTKATGTANNDVATTAFVAATALAASLPGQTGNAGKFIATDGISASWKFPALTTVEIAANTTAEPGKHYVATAPGLTLTVPAGWTAGSPLAGRNVSGGDCFIDWGANTVAGQTPQSPMRWPALGRFETTYTGSTFA